MEEALTETMYEMSENQELPDAVIDSLCNEEGMIYSGNKIIFPGNTELLDMLWNAKIDINLSDISFPKCFRISWPENFNVNGIKPFPCCFWFGTLKERMQLEHGFNKKYFQIDLNQCSTMSKIEQEIFKREDLHLMAISYYDPDEKRETNFFVSLIPNISFVDKYLCDEEKLSTVFEEEYGGKKRVHITIKLIFRLMVYATACPEAVIDGFPKGVDDFSVSGGWTKKHSPVYFRMPSVGRTGTIPTLHKRRWHFRQYPIKKDETRTPGVVFVKECWVNANVDPKVDPKTVVNVL